MKIFRLAIAALICLIVIPAKAQTADEIIAKHIEAIGGKDNLKKVTSLYTEGSTDLMGSPSPLTTYKVDGKGFKSELSFNGSLIVNGFNDKGAWSINPFGGNAAAVALTDEMYQSQKTSIYTGGILLDYASKGATAELVGKEEGAYKIKLTTNNAPTFFFVDTATYYIKKQIVKSELMGESLDVTTSYSDYKKVDPAGIVIPYAYVMDIGQYTLSTSISKVEINKQIDTAIFEMPK